jgi:hypothetical protein
MLVSFCSRSVVACSLSSIYRVIYALYRVIDTTHRGIGVLQCFVTPLAHRQGH